MHNKLFSNRFAAILLKWNKNLNKRSMPWKGEENPYKIWLSEIILQQTRVEQGLKYYENFVNNYPTINDLANASDAEVFKLWEGLGYYSRCRNLIATAKHISLKYQGQFPTTYEEILRLKGVGPYTAAAIASFAFNLPHAVVDGNVFRVLARIFGVETPIDSTEGKKYFMQLANWLMDKNNAGEYNQAIMDFGATICKPVAPLCHICVFQKYCTAFHSERINMLPLKEKKILQRTRYFYFFIISYKNKIVVKERVEKDIWRGLHQFPLVETNDSQNTQTVVETGIKKGWLHSKNDVMDVSKIFSQKLTHQTIKSVFITIRAAKKPTFRDNYFWVDSQLLQTLAFPKMLSDYMNKNNFDIIFYHQLKKI